MPLMNLFNPQMLKSISKSKAQGSNPTTAASGPSEPTTDLNPDTGNNEVSFRSLTMLLTLATAVNNDGNPTLSKKLDGKFHQTRDTPQQNRAIAMDAVGCILVRDWEVIAVAGCDPEYKHDDWSAQGKIDIIAVGEDTDWDNMTAEELEAVSVDQFTA